MKEKSKFELQMALSQRLFNASSIAFDLWMENDGSKEELEFYDKLHDLIEEWRDKLEDYVESIDWDTVTPDYLRKVWTYYEDCITEWDEAKSARDKKRKWIEKGWKVSEGDKEDLAYLVGQYKRAVALGYTE